MNQPEREPWHNPGCRTSILAAVAVAVLAAVSVSRHKGRFTRG